MSLLGKKPFRLELLLGFPKNWDTRKLEFQFDTCFILENRLILKSLPHQFKHNVEITLEWENLREVVLSKRFFKLRLQTRDQWIGDYPTVLVPFGFCPKKMIFRFTKEESVRAIFIKELEAHGVMIQYQD